MKNGNTLTFERRLARSFPCSCRVSPLAACLFSNAYFLAEIIFVCVIHSKKNIYEYNVAKILIESQRYIFFKSAKFWGNSAYRLYSMQEYHSYALLSY